jgi:hypothetical protein
MPATPTAAASGTQTAVINTEHTLFDTSAAGVYAFRVDKNLMQDLDVLEVRVYEMVLTSGTRRVAYMKRFTNAQPTDDMIADSVSVWTDLSDSGALRFTLKQTAGTGRNFPWKVGQF